VISGVADEDTGRKIWLDIRRGEIAGVREGRSHGESMNWGTIDGRNRGDLLGKSVRGEGGSSVRKETSEIGGSWTLRRALSDGGGRSAAVEGDVWAPCTMGPYNGLLGCVHLLLSALAGGRANSSALSPVVSLASSR